MQSRGRRVGRLSVMALAVMQFAALTTADVTMLLKNDFIRTYKSRATITVDDFHVHAAKRVKPAKSRGEDGDIHISGTSETVGLPLVVEIMNAKGEPDAVQLAKGKANGAAVRVSGIWRIWCEHGGGYHVQGQPIDPYDEGDTNPDHIFEIHPVTAFGPHDTTDSLGPIPGYEYKDAGEAFDAFESAWCRIRALGDGTTRITTTTRGYNYVAFRLRPLKDRPPSGERPGRKARIERSDGLTVRSAVLSLDGDLVVADRRMVFVKGTLAEQRIRGLPQGKCLEVLGIPRLNLELVNWRISPDGQSRGALDWGLPYEIVILGLLSDSTECGEGE